MDTHDHDPGAGKLDEERLQTLLIGPQSPWQRVVVAEQAGSTNADLADWARTGKASDGTALLTGYQSRGRGRLDRSWSAPPETSLAISLLVVPGTEVPAERWTWLPLIAGMATSEAIRRATDVPTLLKWPNDVMVADRKLCGILAERVETPDGPGCVIGIGVNTDLTEEQLPVPWATSLLLAGARTRDKNTVAATILRAFGLLYRNWLDDFDGSALARSYVARCATIGREVRVVLSDSEDARGRAEAIDDHGRLVVRTADGLQTFGAGDVVHLR
ncbi:biotin--[acetyl-CoA-carboxylase] ligase [Microlunatus soli]|uniref:biotin--[biotin carboxyl-carrier protein] ligase n=1 Tax=Microlunatus soli TaxID=630515 RepID=A0A1H1X9Z1_9ACTN|nr:biotin--[acetyl-CoA-carboxylase] ligase [Microlunatus soli]SDT06143.1 BirA family transcriptional regulator, biotin operon repressor / biotin-[acetyl-CoA-carboxylase] ligase [Microlunatus soli]